MDGGVRWRDWEDVTLTDWEDAGEMAIDREFNDAIREAIEDGSPWYRDGSTADRSIVGPAALAQRALLLIVDEQYRMADRAEQSALHAQQDSTVFRPLRAGETVKVQSRVAEKYERRNKKWLVFEVKFSTLDGEPVYFYRQLRMARDDGRPAGAAPMDEKGRAR